MAPLDGGPPVMPLPELPASQQGCSSASADHYTATVGPQAAHVPPMRMRARAHHRPAPACAPRKAAGTMQPRPAWRQPSGPRRAGFKRRRLHVPHPRRSGVPRAAHGAVRDLYAPRCGLARRPHLTGSDPGGSHQQPRHAQPRPLRPPPARHATSPAHPPKNTHTQTTAARSGTSSASASAKCSR